MKSQLSQFEESLVSIEIQHCCKGEEHEKSSGN